MMFLRGEPFGNKLNDENIISGIIFIKGLKGTFLYPLYHFILKIKLHVKPKYNYALEIWLSCML